MSNLSDINVRIQRENIQLTTGRQMVDLSDDPKAVGNIQYYNAAIDQATNYMNNASSAIDQLTNTSDILDSFSSTLLSIRQTATDSLLVDNSDKLPTLGGTIKTMLHSLIDNANTNFNGTYSFAGTKNTAASLNPTPPATNNLPFELVQDTPTGANPSGLRVVFKGNLEKQSVNTAANSSEQANVTADEVFGSGGLGVFNTVVDLYNKLMFRADGSPRNTSSQPFTADEEHQMQDSIKQIADAVDFVDRGNATVGTRLNRMQAIKDQMNNDISRTKDLRSGVEDADVAETIMQLNKDQMALQYAMQTGTKLFGKTLMDFLG